MVVLVLLIAGTAWNFVFAVKLHAAESPGGAPAALLYDGKERTDATSGFLPHTAWWEQCSISVSSAP